jgi:hypothetical protein
MRDERRLKRNDGTAGSKRRSDFRGDGERRCHRKTTVRLFVGRLKPKALPIEIGQYPAGLGAHHWRREVSFNEPSELGAFFVALS